MFLYMFGLLRCSIPTRLASGDLVVSGAVAAWPAPTQVHRCRSALERLLAGSRGASRVAVQGSLLRPFAPRREAE